MTLTATTLASGLETLEVTDDVNVAIERIATAFTNYMVESSVLGITAEESILAAVPKTAMQGAMSGLNLPNGAALAMSLGITAFWTAMLGIEITIWTMVPPVVIIPSSLVAPVGLAGLQVAIQTVFTANTAAALSLSDAATAVANAIHTIQIGATVQTQIPPAPPVITPIL